MHTFYQPYPHEFQWTKDRPPEQVIGEPSRPVLTRNQLRYDGDMCMYTLTVSTMEPKNVKEAMTDPALIESMQEELLQFKRMDVWVLVPTPDNISLLTLKWIFKNKHDENKRSLETSLDSDQKDNTHYSSKNTMFAKQPTVEIPSKIGETNALSKPVTSNSVSTLPVSKGVNNAKVIAPGMFRICPNKIYREAKKVPNTV
nr:hypothetical protein [Tanacetum cinerariifolium]